MNQIAKLSCVLSVAGIFLLASANSAQAQLDRVYDKAGDNVGGNVTNTSKDGVELTKGNTPQNIPAGTILRITFAGEPPELTQARQFALDGQYDQALTELKQVNAAGISREMIKADFTFFVTLCRGKLALAGKEDKSAAATLALSFARDNQNSFHFYEVTRLLGDLALALNNHENAARYYGALANAQDADTKIESVYLTGLVQLKKQSYPEATAEFDKVIGLNPQTPTAVRLQTLAKAGKAVALSGAGQGAEGLTLVNELIETLNPTDTEMAARIYNALGASHEAGGDKESAILAYLHTHLMFSTQPDAHAHALKRLAELWPQVGKPERAAEARQELQQRYPGF